MFEINKPIGKYHLKQILITCGNIFIYECNSNTLTVIIIRSKIFLLENIIKRGFRISKITATATVDGKTTAMLTTPL